MVNRRNNSTYRMEKKIVQMDIRNKNTGGYKEQEYRWIEGTIIQVDRRNNNSGG